MSKNRGRAYRRWKTFTKYVEKLKERMGWYVDDPNAPRETSTKWSSKWEDADDHTRIKKLRREGKDLIDDELKGEEK